MKIKGTKIQGDGRGKILGFPTINISIPQQDKKERGVFIVEVFFWGKIFFGLLHIGERPTFESNDFRVEVFLFNFSEEVKEGEEITIILKEKIRDIIKFSSEEELIAQIQKDKEKAKIFFCL